MKKRGGQLSPSVSIKQQLGLRLPVRHRAERKRKEEAVSAFLKESSGSSCTCNWTYQKNYGVGKDTLESGRSSTSSDLRWKKLLWKVNTHRNFHRSMWLGRQKGGSRWRWWQCHGYMWDWSRTQGWVWRGRKFQDFYQDYEPFLLYKTTLIIFTIIITTNIIYFYVKYYLDHKSTLVNI